MKSLCIFAITVILLMTMISSAVKPTVHKQYIIAPHNFKMEGLSHRPADLQSVQMFKLGDAPVKIVNSPLPAAPAKEEPVIIPSNVKIIPSDFIQQAAPQNNNTQNTVPPQPDNSDKVLEQIEKILSNEIPNAIESSKEQECSICDGLKDPKLRTELIAWNKYRSDIQNRIMETSVVEAPYGTLFYFTFKIDKNRRITNIKISSSRPNRQKDIDNIRRAIMQMANDRILDFPKGTNRTSITFAGGFLMSDYESFSSPSDFKDFEYVQY